MKTPYCNGCDNQIFYRRSPNEAPYMVKCSSFAKVAWNGSKLDPGRHTELEIDDGLVLKCPQCLQAEERINKGVM